MIEKPPSMSENSKKSKPETLDKIVEEKDRYNPFEKEKYWQDFWEREGTYRFNPEQPGPLYIVDTPPPTISGALHLGHVFSYTQAETISRFKRMQGANVRYPFGLDNNGLPTERLVEKETGTRGGDVSLEDFTKICLEVTDKYKHLYENLWKSLGLSVDWRLEYSSISPEVQKISQATFKELYERGIIYRKNAPALYCTECRTSFAQAEKEDKEKAAIFYDLSFKTKDGGEVIVATTRPELLPACKAVFVHPDDQKFQHLVGKNVITPLGQEVRIMTDEKVAKEKGTGAVMCCTYGDETDIYWAKKYNLSEKILIDKNGKFQNIPENQGLVGKNVDEAREVIVEKLKASGFIQKEENITHNVDVHERCGTPVEFLPTTQWFMKVLDMKERLLEAGNQIHWYPAHMKKRYEEWVTNLKWDWCISRERFYGIPIPAFTCDHCGKIDIPGADQLPVDPKARKGAVSCHDCGVGKMIPERDVLDTWFTSALSPEINNDHPLNGRLNGKMYPMSMRPQAHDIIRTWAVYSILMGLYKHNMIPWKDLMVSGHMLLRKGEKLSKKTGGGQYKPETMIATYSADAVRYAMSGVSLGKDSSFEEKEVLKGRKLVTKIYNAGKLVLGRLQDFNPETELQGDNFEAIDQWILGRTDETARKMSEAFSEYEFSRARQIFEDFFWADFCDNYLEIIKGRFPAVCESENERRRKTSAQIALYRSFLAILKMASPFVPHITEELYHSDVRNNKMIDSAAHSGYLYKNEGTQSIHNTRWPIGESGPVSTDVARGAELTLFIIAEVRKFKTQKNMKLSVEVANVNISCTTQDQEILTPFIKDIASVVRAKDVKLLEGDEMKISVEV